MCQRRQVRLDCGKQLLCLVKSGVRQRADVAAAAQWRRRRFVTPAKLAKRTAVVALEAARGGGGLLACEEDG